jgi:hypothetical protein
MPASGSMLRAWPHANPPTAARANHPAAGPLSDNDEPLLGPEHHQGFSVVLWMGLEHHQGFSVVGPLGAGRGLASSDGGWPVLVTLASPRGGLAR